MFDFSPHILSMGEHGWYDSKEIKFEEFKKAIINSQLECEDVGFLANIIENHDEPRGASRYLPEYAQNSDGVKMLGTISVLLRGLPFLYQGQEIGMRNCRMDSIDEYDDINTKGEYKMAIKAGLTEEKALEACYKNSRDNARTPMQWNDSENAGFTTGRPWLKVNPNYKEINVKEQQGNEDSVLNYYKKLIALRKSKEYNEIFTYGKFIPMFEKEEGIFAYERKLESESVKVIANFGKEEKVLNLENISKDKIILNNMSNLKIEKNQLILCPCQVVVVS